MGHRLLLRRRSHQGEIAVPLSCAATWTAIRYRALEPRARLYRGRSVDAAPLVEDESLDMAFIVRAGDSRERKLQLLLQEERDSVRLRSRRRRLLAILACGRSDNG